MATETCEPPEGHRGHRWHWLRHSDAIVEPVVKRWLPASGISFWDWGAKHVPAEIVAGMGWRYVGPAIPPAVEEGG